MTYRLPGFRQALENRDDAIALSAQPVCVDWRAGGIRGVGREHCADAALPAATDSSGAGMLDSQQIAEQGKQTTVINDIDQREQPVGCSRWSLSHLIFDQPHQIPACG